MAEIIIGSYFFNDGNPATGLNPTIRIWELTASGQSLVVGESGGAGTDGLMVEVSDGTSADGLYRFTFSTTEGYDPTKSYAFRVDGGSGQNQNERYQVGELNTMDNVNAVVDLIYDEPADEHLIDGTFGYVMNQINATTTQLFLDVRDLTGLVDLLIKYSANRTRFDGNTKQLIIYDDDCVTPLRTFNMYDSNGDPSLTEMCERVPTSASDGQPVCS